MTALHIAGVLGGEQVEVTAQAGDWITVPSADAAAVVTAVAGLVDNPLRVHLGDEDLSDATPVQRHRAQLCVASCRLDPLPALRVGDVIGLGLRAPQPALWQSLVGTAGARASSADDEAQVRALAGRVGLAAWVDRTAVNLPLKIEALVDLARALAGMPKALVWRAPEWLDPQSLQELTTAIAAEQRIAGFAGVEFVRRAGASLASP